MTRVTTPPHDNAARRAFWTDQMERAYTFMQRMMDYPVAECGEPLRPLQEGARGAGVEVAFSETPIGGGLARMFYVRLGLMPAFLAAARAMNERGWTMKVEDAYRTRDMQKRLGEQESVVRAVIDRCVWELEGKTPPADFVARRMAAVVARCPKVGTHMSGSALDISVLSRDDGREVDRGAPYLEMSELTPMESPFVSPAAQRNRREITALMKRAGFFAYPFEFWHYNVGDAYAESLAESRRPARYGAVDWTPSTGAVTPTASPHEPLTRLDEWQAKIAAALSG